MGRPYLRALCATLVLALALPAGPAFAHHKDGHDKGKGHKQNPAAENANENSAKSDKNSDGKPGNGPKDQNGDGKPGNGPKTEGQSNGNNGNSNGNNGNGNGNNGNDAPIESGAPGNNGTIKIDGEPFDTTRNNEPHPGCIFRVLYFGFDEGEDLNSTLTFEAHPPTGGPMTFTDTITLGDGDPDIAGPYDLRDEFEAAGIEPHPKQGYHVKLTTNTEYSQGADVKHKVFWINCTDDLDEATPLGDDSEVKDEEHSTDDDDVSVLGSTLSRSGEGDANASAADEAAPAVAAAPEDVEVSGGVLPFTGGNVLTFVVVALALIAAGAIFMRLRRRENP